MKKFIIFSILALSVWFLQHKASADDVLTWGDCLSEAKANHPDLISAEEKVNQEKEAKVITGSVFYPQVDGSLDWSQTKTTTKKK